MSLTAYPKLFAKLSSKKFRDAFCSSSVRYHIALQIRALRKELFGSQQSLGEAMGKPANVISRLESPGYGKVTVQTLLELASAFDVGLIIKFARFQAVVEYAEDLNEASLVVPEFDSEIEEESANKKLESLSFLNKPHADKAPSSALDHINTNGLSGYGLGSFLGNAPRVSASRLEIRP